MNNENSNETQIEELDADQLQDAQGGFKVDINGRLSVRQSQLRRTGYGPMVPRGA